MTIPTSVDGLVDLADRFERGEMIGGTSIMKKLRIALLALILVVQVGILIMHQQQRKLWDQEEAQIQQLERAGH